MKNEVFLTRKHSGKVVLVTSSSVGNGTVKVSSTPFPLHDTEYYQVSKSGDYVQEKN